MNRFLTGLLRPIVRPLILEALRVHERQQSKRWNAELRKNRKSAA